MLFCGKGAVTYHASVTRYTKWYRDIIIIIFQAPALTVIARRRNSQVAYPVGLRRKTSRTAGAGEDMFSSLTKMNQFD